MPDMTPGVASALSPLVRRIVAPNPGLMTGPGTNTYLVGIDEVAVIDPGPDDPGHIEAIVGASMRERVRWILVTHHHVDHSAGVCRLKEATGAEIVAFGPPKSADAEWAPDRKARDGEVIEGTEWGLEVLHTPGHASDHLCYYLVEERALFTGDVILGGSTTVIPADDGDLLDYLASLRRLLGLDVRRIYPAHGPVIEDGPARIREYIDHRMLRERQILEALADHVETIPDLVKRIYVDVAPALHPVAALSVESHLKKLAREQRVHEEKLPDKPSRWTLINR